MIRARSSINSSDEVRWSKPPQPLPGDQGLAFQTHALQILLFELLTYKPNTRLGSLQIESIQLMPSVGKTFVLVQAVDQGNPSITSSSSLLCPSIKFRWGLRFKAPVARTFLGVSNVGSTSHTLTEGLTPPLLKKLSFGQNQGIVWSSDSNLWGNQLLKKLSFGQN